MIKRKLTGYQTSVYSLYVDMINQPHLLIAGTTGSGKSVLLHNLIHTSLCYKPGTSYIMIDVKRVELSRYRKTPQCIYYASEQTQVITALRYALQIIENRYKRMQKAGETYYSGSHVYVIIDELADIMTTQKKQCMPLLQRVAQIGRAAKIHIIACTQCPLSSIIPTQIKVNFSARVGLRTRNKQDSRNIIDCNGCEKLPKYGYGYYVSPDYGTCLTELPLYKSDIMIECIKHYEKQLKRH